MKINPQIFGDFNIVILETKKFRNATEPIGKKWSVKDVKLIMKSYNIVPKV